MEGDPFSEQWNQLETSLGNRFGKTPNLEAILFLIGIQELGSLKKKYSKEQKQDLIHIAVCTLLGMAGYYRLDHRDAEGWPHFTSLKPLPPMGQAEQEKLLKEQILVYFEAGQDLSPGNGLR